MAHRKVREMMQKSQGRCEEPRVRKRFPADVRLHGVGRRFLIGVPREKGGQIFLGLFKRGRRSGVAEEGEIKTRQRTSNDRRLQGVDILDLIDYMKGGRKFLLATWPARRATKKEQMPLETRRSSIGQDRALELVAHKCGLLSGS